MDFQVPRFPDAAASAAAADGRTLRSQPDPSPNAPRDQIRRKGPCCDIGRCDFQISPEFQRLLIILVKQWCVWNARHVYFNLTCANFFH